MRAVNVGSHTRIVMLALVLLASACAHRIPPLDPMAPVQLEVDVVLDRDTLELHLSRPCELDVARPMIMFATGDGGWRGKDKDAFEHMIGWGYAIAGFSSPKYLTHIVRHTHATTPADVARDYDQMIGMAKQAMGLSADTPTVLVGISRGSGLAVAAAGEPELQPSLEGVVAVALTREEEYVKRPKRRRPASGADSEMVMQDNYEYLPRLHTLPLVIIQSTHDDYLPAEEARRLLGPDSPMRQLRPIGAKNHSFSNARETLYEELRSSLEWIGQVHTP